MISNSNVQYMLNGWILCWWVTAQLVAATSHIWNQHRVQGKEIWHLQLHISLILQNKNSTNPTTKWSCWGQPKFWHADLGRLYTSHWYKSSPAIRWWPHVLLANLRSMWLDRFEVVFVQFPAHSLVNCKRVDSVIQWPINLGLLSGWAKVASDFVKSAWVREAQIPNDLDKCCLIFFQLVLDGHIIKIESPLGPFCLPSTLPASRRRSHHSRNRTSMPPMTSSQGGKMVQLVVTKVATDWWSNFGLMVVIDHW